MGLGRLILRFFKPRTRQTVEHVALTLSVLNRPLYLPTTIVDLANCTVSCMWTCLHLLVVYKRLWPRPYRHYLLSEFWISYMRTGSCAPFISRFTQDLQKVGALPYLWMNGFQHQWLWGLAEMVSNAGFVMRWPKSTLFLSESHIPHLRKGDNSLYNTELVLRVGWVNILVNKET